MHALMLRVPRLYMATGLLCGDFLLFYLDILAGPKIPLTVFYLLLVFLSLKYVDSRFAYLFVFVTSLGKTYVKNQFYPGGMSPLLDLWQFFTVYSLYTMICYLLDAQMSRRREVEAAYDELSKLHRSIIDGSDSGVMVFKSSGECILANEAAAAIVGCPLQEMMQSNFREIETWKASGMLRAAEIALETGVLQRISTPQKTSFGKDLWCIASIGRIDRKTDDPYLFTVFYDMSAYKEAERKIISIGEETRQRIGQELHDDLGQHLTGIAFMSEVLFKRLKSQRSDSEREAATITSLINEAITKTRKLAQGLYPVEMAENGLQGMLEQLAGNVAAIHQRNCVVTCSEERPVDDAHVIINLFRIAQEAVNNAIRHGGATEIALHMVSTSGGVTLQVDDNGSGLPDDFEAKGGIGMHSMRYRASILGATLNFSALPDGGTRVAISLPAQ